MTKKGENSYSNILKRLSAFGGVQIFNILIGLIRGKFVAMFLGPVGMGISSLYTSSTAPLQQICGLGLNLAVVKEIAADKKDPGRLRKTITVVLRLLLFTSLLGAFVCGAAAPLWSKITFGDFSHTVSYIFLSVFMALSIGGAGLLAILQGLGEVKRLAKASLVGGLAGLCFGVPLYYFFYDRGIVPAMIILAFSTFLFYYISYRKSKKSFPSSPSDLAVSREERKSLTKKLLSIGFILLIGTLIGQLVSYAINLFVRMAGSIDDVGLFQGANSITNQYVGLIISALALDYFPRLSSCAKDNDKMREVVNRQIEIVMLVATPLIILLIISAPLIIRILLTDSFLVIIPLMRWMGLGMIIQLLGFPIGYIYIAKDDRKAYIWLECIWTNICWILCSIGFYYLLGLVGLGVSLVVRASIDIIINLWVCHRRYKLLPDGGAVRIIFFSILLCATAFIASFLKDSLAYSIMGLLLCLSLVYSFFMLKNKVSS